MAWEPTARGEEGAFEEEGPEEDAAEGLGPMDDDDGGGGDLLLVPSHVRRARELVRGVLDGDWTCCDTIIGPRQFRAIVDVAGAAGLARDLKRDINNIIIYNL